MTAGRAAALCALSVVAAGTIAAMGAVVIVVAIPDMARALRRPYARPAWL